VGVVDDERDLGLVVVGPHVVAGQADDLVAEQGDEAHVGEVVDVDDAIEVAGRQARQRAEVPEVDRLARLAHVERVDRLGISRDHRSDVHRAAVGQHRVELPTRRVTGRHGRGRRLRFGRLDHGASLGPGRRGERA
jgi:hypothetical protein